MSSYDAIVVGAGLTGSGLAYELAKQNRKVLLVEKNLNFSNGTVYSYGGIAYWCGTDDRTISLCQEGLKIQQNLTDELDYDIQYRDLDLLFTIPHDKNPQQVAKNYQDFWIKPELLNVEDSSSLEPLLNQEAISGCLRFPHGHVNPCRVMEGYQKAFKKLGGEIREELVMDLETNGSRTIGIKTEQNNYFAEEIILCAGAFCRHLLGKVGINLPIYFTHAQLIRTKPTDLKLRCLVMPSTTARFLMEKDVTALAKDSIWTNPSDDLQGEVVEPGAIQFLDGSFCLGQISQIRTNPHAPLEPKASEKKIRGAIAHYLPSLAHLEGQWHNCQVAFSKDVPFQVGRVDNIEGLSVFSGFTSPFVFVPPLARKFTHFLTTGEGDFTLKTS